MQSPLRYLLWLACMAGVAAVAPPPGFFIDPAPPSSPPKVVYVTREFAAGKPHLLSWKMRVEGTRSWRFRARFAGISISLLDSQGAPIAVLSRHTHCYQTAAAQDAWMLVDIPAGTARVEAAFSIVSQDPLPGRFWVGDFKLATWDATPRTRPGMAALTLAPTLEDGTPTPSRLSIRNENGKPVSPPNTFGFGEGRSGFHLSSPSLNRFLLPPGTYQVAAMKGFEYAPVNKSVTLAEGTHTKLPLVLRRSMDLSKRGWYPGDHHVHLFRHAGSIYPFMNLDDVYNIAQGEGLAYVGFMGEDQVEPSDRLRESNAFLGWFMPELTRDLWGHLCPIGLFEWPRMERHRELWPMNVDWMDAAEKAGGAIAYAHPYARLNDESLEKVLSDPTTGHAARELPVDAALGRRFTIDMVTEEGFGSDDGVKLRDYFRLLNLGFRLGVSGSTDHHADQGRQPPGAMRTYVRAQRLALDNIAQAYREGRTFATNGPLLLLTVNGAQPGDAFKVNPGDPVDCAVEAFSNWSIGEATLWYNGEAVKKWSAPSGATIRARHRLTVPRSGWIAATANSPAAGAGGQFAITSPVYVEVPGHPLPPQKEAAHYFMRWIDAARRGFEVAGGSAMPPALRRQVLSRFEQARSVFAEKAR